MKSSIIEEGSGRSAEAEKSDVRSSTSSTITIDDWQDALREADRVYRAQRQQQEEEVFTLARIAEQWNLSPKTAKERLMILIDLGLVERKEIVFYRSKTGHRAIGYRLIKKAT